MSGLMEFTVDSDDEAAAFVASSSPLTRAAVNGRVWSNSERSSGLLLCSRLLM